jgi:hypothetical protein
MNNLKWSQVLVLLALAACPIAWIGCEPTPVPVKQSATPSERSPQGESERREASAGGPSAEAPALPIGQKRAARGPAKPGQSETNTGRAQNYGSASQATPLMPSRNLQDLTNPTAARGFLGLGSAATYAASAFDAAGVATTAQTNAEAYTAAQIAALGLGSASTKATSFFDVAGSAGTAQSTAETFATAAIAALGLGSASTKATSFFDVAGAAGTAQSTAEAFATAAISALGLGSASTQSSSAFDAAGAATNALTSAETAAAATYVPLSAANAALGYVQPDASNHIVGTITERTDTAANLAAAVPATAQAIYANDTFKWTIGNNSTAFANLAGWGPLGTSFNIFSSSIQTSNANATSTRTRGAGAVDLAMVNSGDASDVASGANSTLFGYNSRASGQYAYANGANCQADGSSSIAMGDVMAAPTTGAIGIASPQGVTNGSCSIGGAYAGIFGGAKTVNNGTYATVAGGYGNSIGNAAMAFTLPGGASTTLGEITAAGNFVQQITGTVAGSSGPVYLVGLSGGTNNTKFVSQQTVTSVTYNTSGTYNGFTTFTLASTIDDQTGGNLIGLDQTITTGASATRAPFLCNMPGTHSYIAGGVGNSSQGVGSFHHGYFGKSYMPNQHVHGANIAESTTAGKNQGTDMVLVGKSTSATSIVLNTDGEPLGYTKQAGVANFWGIPTNQTCCYSVQIVARGTGGTVGNASWIYHVLACNTGTAGGTSIIGSTLVSGLSDSTNSSNTWGVAFTADTTNQGVICTCTGVASTTISWTAYVHSAESNL